MLSVMQLMIIYNEIQWRILNAFCIFLSLSLSLHVCVCVFVYTPTHRFWLQLIALQ